MRRYVALLRGINVGGNSLIKMSELKDALNGGLLNEVTTYIQSGNVLFESEETDKPKLGKYIAGKIRRSFGLDVGVIVFRDSEWQKVVKDAPKWWGKDPAWRHYLFVLLEGSTPAEVIEAIGELNQDIEKLAAADGVVYQSVEIAKYGRSRSSRVLSLPAYKRMTIRNYNTTVKLAALLEK
jgi:uncharacterized protein (DUF1697 family)